MKRCKEDEEHTLRFRMNARFRNKSLYARKNGRKRREGERRIKTREEREYEERGPIISMNAMSAVLPLCIGLF